MPDGHVVTLKSISQASVHTSDDLWDITNDLETAVGKLECLEALISKLADDAGDDALLFFSLKYNVDFIQREAREIFDRLFDWMRSYKQNQEAAARSDIQNELEAMARRAWQERGIVILWPDKIEEKRARERVKEIASSLYGSRQK